MVKITIEPEIPNMSEKSLEKIIYNFTNKFGNVLATDIRTAEPYTLVKVLDDTNGVKVDLIYTIGGKNINFSIKPNIKKIEAEYGAIKPPIINVYRTEKGIHINVEKMEVMAGDATYNNTEIKIELIGGKNKFIYGTTIDNGVLSIDFEDLLSGDKITDIDNGTPYTYYVQARHNSVEGDSSEYGSTLYTDIITSPFVITPIDNALSTKFDDVLGYWFNNEAGSILGYEVYKNGVLVTTSSSKTTYGGIPNSLLNIIYTGEVLYTDKFVVIIKSIFLGMEQENTFTVEVQNDCPYENFWRGLEFNYIHDLSTPGCGVIENNIYYYIKDDVLKRRRLIHPMEPLSDLQLDRGTTTRTSRKINNYTESLNKYGDYFVTNQRNDDNTTTIIVYKHLPDDTIRNEKEFTYNGYINSNPLKDRNLFYAVNRDEYSLDIISEDDNGIKTTSTIVRSPFHLQDPTFAIGCPKYLFVLSDRKLYKIILGQNKELIGEPIYLLTLPARDYDGIEYDLMANTIESTPSYAENLNTFPLEFYHYDWTLMPFRYIIPLMSFLTKPTFDRVYATLMYLDKTIIYEINLISNTFIVKKEIIGEYVSYASDYDRILLRKKDSSIINLYL